jgi:hypothetical protein
LLRRAVKEAGSAALVVGQLVAPLSVEVLHVYGVAARTHLNRGPAGDLCEPRSRRNLAIGIIAKL